MPVRRLLFLMLAGAALTPMPVRAQDALPEGVARQMAAMQAEIVRLAAEVAELRKAQETAAGLPAAPPAPITGDAPSAPAGEIAWRGAPEQSSIDGFSFKPRGRIQTDAAVTNLPAGLPDAGLGTEFRRVYLGMEGDLPGSFGYRLEADFAGSNVQLTDVYLTFEPSDAVTFTLGHHKPFNGLEEMTSDLFTSMLERAAFHSAFGFERRIGLSGAYSNGDVLVQAGIFSDDTEALNDDGNDSYSVDGRVVFAPKVGSGRLHLGASAHFRDLNDASATVRYRARPFVHTTDLRLVDTGTITASGERNFGAELAYVRGPFHATIESHWMTALRPGLDDPTFHGGYAEIGFLVTGEDRTAYRDGVYDRIKPANPVTEGGVGAIQLNARYDRIDLNDGAIVGGTQQALGLSAIWMPTDYVRFLFNYGHLWIADAALPAGADTRYQVDTMGVRAQVDF